MILPDLAVRRPVTTSMFFAAFAILGCRVVDPASGTAFSGTDFPEVFVTLSLQGALPGTG